MSTDLREVVPKTSTLSNASRTTSRLSDSFRAYSRKLYEYYQVHCGPSTLRFYATPALHNTSERSKQRNRSLRRTMTGMRHSATTTKSRDRRVGQPSEACGMQAYFTPAHRAPVDKLLTNELRNLSAGRLCEVIPSYCSAFLNAMYFPSSSLTTDFHMLRR
jgi:hypothetical protein